MEIEFNGLGFPSWIIAAVVMIILLVIQVRRRQNWLHICCLAVFGVYILMALNETFFPLTINGLYVETMRSVPIRSFINLVPFYIGTHHMIDGRDLLDFANNILLTIPFGFSVIFVSRLRPRDFLWLPWAVGFGIEASQLLISLILRYPYRVVDINDALLNTVGVLIGYGLFRIFAWLFIRLTRRFKDKSAGWLAYIGEVVTRA